MEPFILTNDFDLARLRLCEVVFGAIYWLLLLDKTWPNCNRM